MQDIVKLDGVCQVKFNDDGNNLPHHLYNTDAPVLAYALRQQDSGQPRVFRCQLISFVGHMGSENDTYGIEITTWGGWRVSTFPTFSYKTMQWNQWT